MDHPANAISILIIEDNPADQLLLEVHLSETNLHIGEVTTASTIKAAIDLLRKQSFSLIFLDFFLPDSSGLQSFIELSQVNAKIPVIILSGLTDTELSIKAISVGAQDFLIKGEYTVQMLEKAVRYSIERKKNLELIEENNERNDIISKATNDIIWDWDLQTNKVKWYGQGLKNYLPENTLEDNVPPDFWVTGLHPEERTKTIMRLHRSILNGGGNWEGDNRFLRIDGTYAHINTRGYILSNPERKATRMIGCMQDITDRKNAELEATKARFDAEEARKTQEQFLVNMSHEIRTPMNGVIGMAHLLAGTQLTKEQSEFVETINESAGNLMVIINDILDLTKIVAGKITIDKVDYIFSDIIKNSVQITKLKAEEKGILLNSRIDRNIHPVLLGDPFRLNQILVNLIGNAIKFTEKGEINIRVNLLEEDTESVKLEFSIQDTGIGIEQDKLDTIFERFTQASSDTTRKFGGTGLGLTITKQLIELQDGSIHVNSKPGVGSTFTFYMRIAKGNAAFAVEKKKPALHGSNTLDSIRILLVEDNLINQKVAVKILTNEGAIVEIANHGKEAISMLRLKEYDIILMDIQMPEMDGYQATNYIRTEMPASISKMPIIAMTASALISEKDKCIIAGMDDYITKPFQAKELFEKILGQLSGITTEAPVI
ncbi:MAG: response regulator [Ferruginibacter sp.]